MSQFLIFTDLHLNPHKRSYDRLNHCLEALEWVFKTARDRKIQNILFCGDLFHDRQKMDIPTYQRTFEIFTKYLSGENHPNIYLLLGNHDMWYSDKWDVSSVFPLAAINGVIVVDKPCVLTIDGYEVGFLPYTHNPIEDLKKITIKDKYKLLCAHCAVDGAVWNLRTGTTADVSIEHDGDMVKITPDVFSDFDRVFLGHYHGEQKLNKKVEYVGSPLQLSFGEAFEKKHIVVFDMETHETEYIKNTFSPEHYIIPEKQIDKYQLENNFVRIMVDDIASSEVIQMKTNILKKNVLGLDIKQTPKKIEEEIQSMADAKSILSQADMLEIYLNSPEIKIGDLNKDLLLEVGRNICNSYYTE